MIDRIVTKDKVLYADGLIFMESQFQTTQKYQSVDPDIMDEAIAVGSVVAVPGSGTDYPVQPGESFILCDNAINHKEANPNSIDTYILVAIILLTCFIIGSGNKYLGNHKIRITCIEYMNLQFQLVRPSRYGHILLYSLYIDFHRSSIL